MLERNVKLLVNVTVELYHDFKQKEALNSSSKLSILAHFTR